MSSITRAARSDTGSEVMLASGAPSGLPFHHFTSWRSAVASMVVLALVVALLVVDLAVPLLR